MTAAELKAKIKTGELAGAYLIAGEEDYLKRYYLDEIVKACCPDEAFALFNRQLFDGADVDIADIREALAAPPMMADYKIVEWRYPDLERATERERNALCELADGIADYPYAVLILFTDMDGFDPGSVKRPSRLCARFAKSFSVVNFEKSTDAQLVAWLKRHFDAAGIATDPAVLAMLIFRSGHAMQVLKNEVDKIVAYMKANSIPALTREIVEQVASSTLECDAFALSGAITDKNRAGAFLALEDMRMRRIDASAVLATLLRSFSELVAVSLLLEEGMNAEAIEKQLGWNSYKIKLSIRSASRWGAAKLCAAKERLRELDAESKSGGATGYKMLEMFICQFI